MPMFTTAVLFVKDNLEPGECDFIIVFPNYGIALLKLKEEGSNMMTPMIMVLH